MNKVRIENVLWLEYRIYQIDPETRIEFGFHFVELGKSYQLQRLEPSWIGKVWVKKAWTFQIIGYNSLDELIKYLLLCEAEDIKKDTPLF
jgi:hypothetical protein